MYHGCDLVECRKYFSGAGRLDFSGGGTIQKFEKKRFRGTALGGSQLRCVRRVAMHAAVLSGASRVDWGLVGAFGHSGYGSGAWQKYDPFHSGGESASDLEDFQKG